MRCSVPQRRSLFCTWVLLQAVGSNANASGYQNHERPLVCFVCCCFSSSGRSKYRRIFSAGHSFLGTVKLRALQSEHIQSLTRVSKKVVASQFSQHHHPRPPRKFSGTSGAVTVPWRISSGGCTCTSPYGRSCFEAGVRDDMGLAQSGYHAYRWSIE